MPQVTDVSPFSDSDHNSAGRLARLSCATAVNTNEVDAPVRHVRATGRNVDGGTSKSTRGPPAEKVPS